MNTRFIGIASLIVGVVLLVFGVQSSDSVASHMSRFFTGSPTDKTVWLLIGGIASSVLGLFWTFRGSRTG